MLYQIDPSRTDLVLKSGSYEILYPGPEGISNNRVKDTKKIYVTLFQMSISFNSAQDKCYSYRLCGSRGVISSLLRLKTHGGGRK